MDDPVKEIEGVITSLAQGNAEEQEATVKQHFLSNASFTHPFCHVPSFYKGSLRLASHINSQWVILCIYRWYRILSPKVEIHVDSVAFDQRHGLLYVGIHQTFAAWFIPFYKAPVKLVTVLRLTRRHPPVNTNGSRSKGDGGSETSSISSVGKNADARQKYFIASQEDLYQMNDCIQFVAPRLGPALWMGWQLLSTALCVVGSLVFLPFYVLLYKGARSEIALD